MMCGPHIRHVQMHDYIIQGVGRAGEPSVHPPEVELMPSPSEYPHDLDPLEAKMAEEYADPHSSGVQEDPELSKVSSYYVCVLWSHCYILAPAYTCRCGLGRWPL